MDRAVPERRHRRVGGVEDPEETSHVGPACQHVPERGAGQDSATRCARSGYRSLFLHESQLTCFLRCSQTSLAMPARRRLCFSAMRCFLGLRCSYRTCAEKRLSHGRAFWRMSSPLATRVKLRLRRTASGGRSQAAACARSCITPVRPREHVIRLYTHEISFVLACSLSVFQALVPVILRLALLPGQPPSHSPVLLARGLRWLEQLEAEVAIPALGQFSPPLVDNRDKTASGNLHRSQHLFDAPPTPTIEVWGSCVESLWRVSMALPTKTAEWDALSSRLLVWRAIAGESRTGTGEWVRREMLEHLRAEA